MEFINTTKAAELITHLRGKKISQRRVRDMCQNRKLESYKDEYGYWVIDHQYILSKYGSVNIKELKKNVEDNIIKESEKYFIENSDKFFKGEKLIYPENAKILSKAVLTVDEVEDGKIKKFSIKTKE